MSGFSGYVLFVLAPILTVIVLLGHADLIADNIDQIESVLRTWWVYPLLMVLGFFLLVYAGYRQQSGRQAQGGDEQTTETAAESAAPIGADSRRAQEAQPPTIRTTPSELISGPCIANQDVSIEDLIRDGYVRDSKIESIEFRNCTIRGPGVVTLEAPPSTEPARGSSARLMMWEAGTCRIEGSPESVLWEVPSGGGMAKGVIYLVGCAFRQVTFRDIAIAGSPNGLQSWKDNCTFTEGSTAPQPASADTDSQSALQEDTIDLGDTARLFLTDGARFVPDDDSERSTIFLPALLDHWAGPLSSAVEAGRTFVARKTEFEDCDIYGPGVLVLAEGTFRDTFHKCDWEEEWEAFWPATKRGRYVGIIALENCTFRRCNFKGVAFVVKSDEYRHLYRRFTGEDLNNQ